MTPAAILLIVTGFISAGPVGIGRESLKARKGIEIPAELAKVFTNSCMPCHSADGKKMAKLLLNFSKWDKYGRGTQVRKGKAICKMITKGSMPPAQFIESSPELALPSVVKDDICTWVSSISSKK